MVFKNGARNSWDLESLSCERHCVACLVKVDKRPLQGSGGKGWQIGHREEVVGRQKIMEALLEELEELGNKTTGDTLLLPGERRTAMIM